MASETADGMDVLAMYESTKRAVERARNEGLPTLIEARTYRYMGHSMADPIHGHYRTKEELEEQKQRDPIESFRQRLFDEALLDQETNDRMVADIEEEVEDAVKFSEDSADPDDEELFTDVYRD